MMAHALRRGLLTIALTVGVPTATEATKDRTTDIRPAQEETIQHDEGTTQQVMLFSRNRPLVPSPAEHAPWFDAGQQSHWLRGYMGFEYRGLERIMYDLDRAGISRGELEEFQRTLRTNRHEEERRLMTSVLAVHGALPPEGFVRDVSYAIGYRPFANDAYLLRRIHDDPQLRSLLFDRERLLDETRRLQTQTHHPRSDDEGRLYDETPDLESLDSLNLVRLNILLRALQDEEVHRSIGNIVSADLANTRTELGGLLYHDDTHHVRFQPVRGNEYSNHSYAGQYYRPLIRALGTFHLHATGSDDVHRYSGPSVPDLRVARTTNTTGVVITHIGGTARAHTVNIDFFYVDARTYNDDPVSAQNPVELSPRTVRVVDMGVFTVRRR